MISYILISILSLFDLHKNPAVGKDKSLSRMSKPVEMEWNVGGIIRKAVVYVPLAARTNKTPIIFAFHGHGGLVESGKGGNMWNMYRTRRFDQLWPEAIFVCPQGLNTPGQLVDPEGKFPGWQKGPGAQDDRDLKFFDAMLTSFIKEYNVDQNRIYGTGHSNGGGFCYLLWATRGSAFAAFAPSAAGTAKTLTLLEPKPVLHIYGKRTNL